MQTQAATKFYSSPHGSFEIWRLPNSRVFVCYDRKQHPLAGSWEQTDSNDKFVAYIGLHRPDDEFLHRVRQIGFSRISVRKCKRLPKTEFTWEAKVYGAYLSELRNL